jgi:eukaryotic translation initiation factor 2C
MSQKPSGKGAAVREKNPLAPPEGINKRCDLPPEAYWVRWNSKPLLENGH